MTYAEATGQSIDEAFVKFHACNPGLYQTLVKISMSLLERGFNQFSFEIVWQHARWLSVVEVERLDCDPYKLNDIYSSRYSRLLMKQEPALRTFFRTRRLRSQTEAGLPLAA